MSSETKCIWTLAILCILLNLLNMFVQKKLLLETENKIKIIEYNQLHDFSNVGSVIVAVDISHEMGEIKLIRDTFIIGMSYREFRNYSSHYFLTDETFGKSDIKPDKQFIPSFADPGHHNNIYLLINNIDDIHFSDSSLLKFNNLTKTKYATSRIYYHSFKDTRLYFLGSKINDTLYYEIFSDSSRKLLIFKGQNSYALVLVFISYILPVFTLYLTCLHLDIHF